MPEPGGQTAGAPAPRHDAGAPRPAADTAAGRGNVPPAATLAAGAAGLAAVGAAGSAVLLARRRRRSLAEPPPPNVRGGPPPADRLAEVPVAQAPARGVLGDGTVPEPAAAVAAHARRFLDGRGPGDAALVLVRHRHEATTLVWRGRPGDAAHLSLIHI